MHSRQSRKYGKFVRKSKKQERKRAEPTTATIQENIGREILKSNGSMTVSKRGNIERRKRRRLPPHCPHHKTEYQHHHHRGIFRTTGSPFFTPGERSNLLTEKKGTPTPPTKPDGIITTQRNGQTIVAELFFNPNGTETFSDKLLKTILADSLRFSASDGQEPEKTEILR